jgi:hypothetical protein
MRVSTWQRQLREEAARTLAVFCVDGRYARYLDEFFESTLQLEGADWLGVPGGAAALAGREAAEGDGEYLWREVDFLVEAHQIEHVILIFHEDCGHYQRVLGSETPAEERAETQRSDAMKVVAEFGERHPSIGVKAYWQRGDDTAVYFDELTQAASPPAEEPPG